ncbi:MAG: ethanolamine ammonia-lyase subunit EutC [Oscillospiraceae bacterium]|jgi:ethanolamine ammonia-lyase small subunit|nr:ethanolamine ammonia-lyase subunit EutC [Oscillospiraceae bacterium]
MNEHDMRRLADAICEAVMAEISGQHADVDGREIVVDVSSGSKIVTPPVSENAEILSMKKTTPARVAVGRAGARLRTETYLAFRADHAAARDAVLPDVAPDFSERLGLETVVTRCADKNEFLTRPDLGRVFPRESLEKIRALNPEPIDVLVYLADGLSSRAVEANGETILPILLEGLRAAGLRVGQPFFVQYGRVGTMEEIAQTTGAAVTCVLLGERPGLGSAQSMSAYFAYNARPGMPESERTVVSNIYSGGINAAEAGAYLTEALERAWREKKSGVA